MEKDLLEQRKKTILELMNDPAYVPMKVKEMAAVLNVSREDREALRQVLEELVDEGRITVNSHGKYRKMGSQVLSGVYLGTRRGFGFVRVEGREDDIYVNEKDSLNALHEDTVLLVLLREKSKDRRAEGKIIKVTARARKTVIGTYEQAGKNGFVIPDNQKIGRDIFIPSGREKGAITGHKVEVTLTDYGDARRNPEGRVVQIIGHINDPRTDILAIIRGYGYETEFPQDVMREVEAFPASVTEEEKQDRLDLREIATVTIDGEDAKDLDDGISLEMKGDHYLLGVHIADVSHYVREGSSLDREALKRGTSVYLVDRVIPMLPHRLSNGICSLNAGEDRLALSCLMELDQEGRLLDHQIRETLIRVDERMSYTAVKKILEDQDPKLRERYKDLCPMFQRMEELAGKLREARKRRGAIDFDFPETKITLDQEGRPVSIAPYERNTATNIIEDFMLLANETIAEDYYWQELPFLYRIHEVPDGEKIQRLICMLKNFGYGLRTKGSEIHPKELQKLLVRMEDSPEEALLSRLVLRSMKQAKYSDKCLGHFGLAASYYCHFTSPIRRYPDLMIHRIIKENLHGGLSSGRIDHYRELLPDVAVKTSTEERRAEEAERETLKVKKAEYMAERIGQEYQGVISGVTSFGLFVELPNTVEGMIRLEDLEEDYFIFYEDRYELIGEETGKVYKLGQKLAVRVTGVDRLARTVLFAPAEYFEEGNEYVKGQF